MQNLRGLERRCAINQETWMLEPEAKKEGPCPSLYWPHDFEFLSVAHHAGPNSRMPDID